MVTTWQAILFGVALAYTPAAVFIAFILWRDSKSSPRQDQREILTPDRKSYSRLSCEIRDRAARINDPLATHNEIAERIQFINSCKLVLLMAGFNVEMLRKAVPIDESEA